MNLLDKKSQVKFYWAGVILHFSLYSFNSLATALIAALIGVKWEVLTHQEKFMIAVAIVANFTGMVLVYTKKGISRLAAGRPPIETGDTDRITKEHKPTYTGDA